MMREREWEGEGKEEEALEGGLFRRGREWTPNGIEASGEYQTSE